MDIKQSDSYTINKIKECEGLIEIQEQKQLEAEQQSLIADANAAYKLKNYETAKDLYQQADNLQISLYAQSQIKQCEAWIERQKSVVIPLKFENNLHYISTKLNDIMTFDFIFDTGASNVLVSSSIFVTFWKAGLITKEDIIGDAKYSIADGSSVNGYKFILKKIQIGNIILTNIEASVMEGGSDLLGGSVFVKLGKFKLDYDKHELIVERK